MLVGINIPVNIYYLTMSTISWIIRLANSLWNIFVTVIINDNVYTVNNLFANSWFMIVRKKQSALMNKFRYFHEIRISLWSASTQDTRFAGNSETPWRRQMSSNSNNASCFVHLEHFYAYLRHILYGRLYFISVAIGDRRESSIPSQDVDDAFVSLNFTLIL